MLRDQSLPIVFHGQDVLSPVTNIGVHMEETSWHVPSLSHKILDSYCTIVRGKEANAKDFSLSCLRNSSLALSHHESLVISGRCTISFTISS
jgi:hypothetical protein